jgi:hypothetical protein
MFRMNRAVFRMILYHPRFWIPGSTIAAAG